MLYQGDVTSDKTNILIKEYSKLLNSGVDSSKILVLLQNSKKREYFSEQVLQNLKINALEKLQIYSFFGLVYNTISDNWAVIENSIPDNTNTKILPILCGLQLSQYLMRDIISNVQFKGYNSKKSLLHQLFRRYSLIVQNNLSPQEVQWRSEKILKESFYPDAKIALDKFKKDTLEKRTFDYLRQTLIFNYIYKNTEYFKNIEYLILDDGDEITPVCYNFIEYLKPQLKQSFIAYDEKGSTRVGYLSADKNAVSEFEKLFSEKPVSLQSKSKMQEDAENIFNNVLHHKNIPLKNFQMSSFLTRTQMLNFHEIKTMLKNGIKPAEITIITPLTDNVLSFCIKNSLYGLCNPICISGSEKLVQNKLVAFCLNVLKLVENSCDDFDLRKVFDFLGIPVRYSDKNWDLPEYSTKYKGLISVVEELKFEPKLSKRVLIIYENLIDKKAEPNDIIKLNFFIKQIEDFESIDIPNSEIISQLENSIISENPIESLHITDNDLIIATPQKVIDNQITTKYQFWLDISSDEWIKSDTGPLYNAWVMQKSWDKDEYTLQDNIELSRQKTARILRKLTLCAKEKIYAYSSLYDSTGIENLGGIESYLTVKQEHKITGSKPFTPREDQKPVLEYKKGQMAISAVPGAGKTTILLELIINLLKKGIAPENIFVMTYMESAARNFRERIKRAAPELVNLPNISTIHGLALRILKENNNFERLGLNYDFDICDDSKRAQILNEIGKKIKITKTESEQFERAISIAKMSNLKEIPVSDDKKIQKFLEFYEDYNRILKENNLIDYDDMLLSSVKLLRENEDILNHYRNICEYLIEDEAQDSSSIQQELISLLSSKHKNVIRCGDINQAITTTFSNADVEGFKTFIKKSKQCVNMNCSQRCTKDVWQLANKLVSTYKTDFYETYMQPVDGRNPIEKNALKTMVLEDESSERAYVLKQIKSLLQQNPKYTVGILLRNNFQVNHWTNFIEQSGIKTIVRNECLEQKQVFRTILAILKIIANPFDNLNLADNYQILAEQGFYKTGYYQIIKSFEKPFIQANLDDLKYPDMTMFLWDMIYWINFPTLSPDELAIKIGLHYYSGEIDKSNVYIISAFIKRLNMPNLANIVNRLGELSKKANVSGIKFYSEEENDDMIEGKVQVMTMHKSKGDEFDIVFMPEMTESSLPLTTDGISLRKDASFMENVRELSKEYKPKSDNEIKQEILEENLRLMYVAITRAKRKLFVTVSKNNKKKSEPNFIFDLIEEVKQ
ncbi:ATP-dependent helicase [bacterium]|nr:ATP-dependent helicase [bacterium]